jgi:hypothetical protein
MRPALVDTINQPIERSQGILRYSAIKLNQELGGFLEALLDALN